MCLIKKWYKAFKVSDNQLSLAQCLRIFAEDNFTLNSIRKIWVESIALYGKLHVLSRNLEFSSIYCSLLETDSCEPTSPTFYFPQECWWGMKGDYSVWLNQTV